MKRLLIIILTIHNLIVFAQDETATLFKTSNIKTWGIMAGAELQNTKLYNEYIGASVLKAGVIINNSWTFGGFIGESFNYITPNLSQQLRPLYEEFDFSIYGAFIEYRLKPSSMLHLVFPLSFGVFDADYDYFDDYLEYWDDYDERYNFFMEPGINLELNLAKNLKIYSGLSYRLNVIELYREGTTVPNAQNHLLFNVGLKLGMFSITPK